MQCKDVLKKIIKERSLTISAIARGCGVSRPAVARWIKGEAVPYGKNLTALSQFLNIKERELLFGCEEEVKTYIPEEDTIAEGYVSIPEYRMMCSAGNGYDNDWEEVNNSEPAWYKESFFKSRGINPKNCRRATVDGDSMTPYICDGDKVLFCYDHNLSLKEIKDGSVYVLSVDGMLRIKRLSVTKDGLTVRSDNPQYKDETFSGSELESVVIYGRVIEITRVC